MIKFILILIQSLFCLNFILRYEIEYEDSKKSTKEIIMPLKLQLKDIEDEIKAVISKISSAKATNAKNDDQIHQQLKLIADLT